jgi:ATP-dependent helicase/nuclease subunit B
MMRAGEAFAAAPRLFTIDSGRPFLVDLARGLIEIVDGDPIALSEIELFLPNRRAARALADAFIEIGGGRATLLPRIRPLGDSDEAAALIGEPEAPAPELPDAVGSLERRLVLARFVAAARERSFDGQETPAGALKAADALGAFLDSLYTEEAEAAKLEGAAPEAFAAHWRRSLDFLKIVTEAWPLYLERRGLDDPARRRAQLISRQADMFARTRPTHPVVIAGTTGSMPAVRRLAASVAALPRGMVVLPGLDRGLVREPAAWSAVDDAHPQAGLKALLESLDVAASDVRLWPASRDAGAPRARLLSVALRPASATGDWRMRLIEATTDDPGVARATEGLTLVEAADEEEEASAIAIALRETLETARETALLVTPDRNLARRVAAKMRRWGVDVYDSGGTPFANTTCGTFLRLTSEAFVAPDDAQAALALLRHPLCGLGLDEAARRRAVDAFDRAARGLAPSPEAGGLSAKIDADKVFGPIAASVIDALRPPAPLAAGARAPLSELIAAHAQGAERLAATAAKTGNARLWSGEDGAAGAALIGEIIEAASFLGDASPTDYPALFAELIAGAVVRRRSGAHPRIEILGPLEARLQSADRVILAGLNEGVWPGDGGADPFLSRAMRRSLGLPSPERATGLAAHDFAQGAAAPQALLTRARRRAGAPAKPSRWIVRLKNILEEAGALQRIDATARYAALAAALDHAGPARPVAPPAPRPPSSARPRALSVTQIETFLRDPYAVYARHVLRLKPLDPVAEPFGKKHLGTLLHAVFEAFVKDDIDPDEAAARGYLGETLGRFAPRHGLSGADRLIWAPMIENSLDVFLREERQRRAVRIGSKAEISGETTIALDGGPFTLSARADRIDLLSRDRAALIDYKTTPPSEALMRLFRVQLPLTAFIVERGGFAEIGTPRVAAFHYLQALTREAAARTLGYADEAAREAIDKAAAGVIAWLGAFDRPDQAYLSQPRPQFVNEYGDYDLLARRREWSVGGGE